MKPPEILGMLEEAAGTRMYENKKDAALRTLEKKQVKVDEIDKVCYSTRGLPSSVPGAPFPFPLILIQPFHTQHISVLQTSSFGHSLKGSFWEG